MRRIVGSSSRIHSARAPTFSTVGFPSGQVAVAELGDFPVASRGDVDFPEVAVVRSGTVRVQTIGGTVVFGPISIPGGGVGGPPTIGDFDGDGRPEIATAGASSYVVVDLDCVDGGGTGTCASGRTDGILWSQPSQDTSSGVTGSSVFDFDADGHAEAIYADECFFRIYDGATGTVLASLGNRSGTTYENPVVADTDGDFRSEIVLVGNSYTALDFNCPATDPLFPTTASALTRGVAVLRDASDGWAASRPVWNQHAYSVVNVTDTGKIPRTSAVAANWETAGLNNFRQNTQGGLKALGLGDLTVTDGGSRCEGGALTLVARLCNRGALPTPEAVELTLSDGDEEICRERTSRSLAPGECENVECSPTAAIGAPTVTLSADPDGLVGECFELNNGGRAVPTQCN